MSKRKLITDFFGGGKRKAENDEDEDNVDGALSSGCSARKGKYEIAVDLIIGLGNIAVNQIEIYLSNDFDCRQIETSSNRVNFDPGISVDVRPSENPSTATSSSPALRILVPDEVNAQGNLRFSIYLFKKKVSD